MCQDGGGSRRWVKEKHQAEGSSTREAAWGVAQGLEGEGLVSTWR